VKVQLWIRFGTKGWRDLAGSLPVGALPGVYASSEETAPLCRLHHGRSRHLALRDRARIVECLFEASAA